MFKKIYREDFFYYLIKNFGHSISFYEKEKTITMNVPQNLEKNLLTQKDFIHTTMRYSQ